MLNGDEALIDELSNDGLNGRERGGVGVRIWMRGVDLELGWGGKVGRGGIYEVDDGAVISSQCHTTLVFQTPIAVRGGLMSTKKWHSIQLCACLRLFEQLNQTRFSASGRY